MNKTATDAASQTHFCPRYVNKDHAGAINKSIPQISSSSLRTANLHNLQWVRALKRENASNGVEPTARFALGATKKCAHFPTPFAQSALENALKFMQNQSAVDSGRDLFANQQTRNNFCCLVFLTSYKIDKDFQQQRAAKAAAAPQRREESGVFCTLSSHTHTSSIYILGTYLFAYTYKRVCSHVGSAFLQFVCVSGCHRVFIIHLLFFIIYLGFSLSSLKYDVLWDYDFISFIYTLCDDLANLDLLIGLENFYSQTGLRNYDFIIFEFLSDALQIRWLDCWLDNLRASNNFFARFPPKLVYLLGFKVYNNICFCFASLM